VPEVASLTKQLGVKRTIDLLEARRECMPMTFGLFRSQIFLPSDALEWNEERRRIVILHEMAHVLRHDCTTHVLARATLAIYWWNPLAWIAWREFLKERERAADDLVLSTGARPSEYASHLLEIASTMQTNLALTWAAVAIARRSQLEGRLLAILDNGRDRKAVRRMTAISGVALAVAIAAPLAALQSQSSAPSSLGTDPAAVLRSAAIQRDPESLDRAASAAEELGRYDSAQKLLESALALREQRSGRQSVEYGAGLLKLADLEREQGNFDMAQSLYTKALSSLGRTPEAAMALIHMGAIALTDKNVQAAVDDFARAQALDPADAGRSDMWLAIAQQQQENMEQADTSYQSALKKQDPNSEGAATVLELYAQFLRQQGRRSEAKTILEQSLAIRRALGAQAMSAVQGDGMTVYKVGGEISAPVLLSKVEPAYSPDARAAKYQGSVLLYAEVGADGQAHNIRVSRGLGLGLNEKAVQAIRQWNFKPAGKDGRPVTVGVNIEVNFRLL
jgi:TonB family protein